MAPTVERITDIPLLKLGEAPHWDIETQSLYFVDVDGKKINRYVPSTGQLTSASLEIKSTFIIPVKGKTNQFVTSTQDDVNIITWDGVSDKVSKTEKIASPEEGTKNYLNDGKCDPKGRLWVGSVGPQLDKNVLKLENTGSLFSIDNNRQVSTHATEVECSNGITWNAELKQLYHNDSMKGTVTAFDFNIEQGTLTNGRAIFTIKKHSKGYPDGMTIDADGNLWVALFSGYGILQIDPRKPETLLQKVEIPAKQITSLAWGGKNLDELYVTSGNIEFEKDDSLPDNGAIFKITGLGTKGLPMEKFVLSY